MPKKRIVPVTGPNDPHFRLIVEASTAIYCEEMHRPVDPLAIAIAEASVRRSFHRPSNYWVKVLRRSEFIGYSSGSDLSDSVGDEQAVERRIVKAAIGTIEGVFYAEELWVHPDYRRRGIGSESNIC